MKLRTLILFIFSAPETRYQQNILFLIAIFVVYSFGLLRIIKLVFNKKLRKIFIYLPLKINSIIFFNRLFIIYILSYKLNLCQIH